MKGDNLLKVLNKNRKRDLGSFIASHILIIALIALTAVFSVGASVWILISSVPVVVVPEPLPTVVFVPSTTPTPSPTLIITEPALTDTPIPMVTDTPMPTVTDTPTPTATDTPTPTPAPTPTPTMTSNRGSGGGGGGGGYVYVTPTPTPTPVSNFSVTAMNATGSINHDVVSLTQ
jgi:hypothetical protein